MYFTLLSYYIVANQTDEYDRAKKFLDEFPGLEKVEDPIWINMYNLPITALRKLKIKSLTNNETKKLLAELEKILNNDKLIFKYGNNPIFQSSSCSCSGTQGTSGASGITIEIRDSHNRIIGLRGIPQVNKKFNKNFNKVSDKRRFKRVKK